MCSLGSNFGSSCSLSVGSGIIKAVLPVYCFILDCNNSQVVVTRLAFLQAKSYSSLSLFHLSSHISNIYFILLSIK
jgi:hypothetical protein